MTIKVLVVDDSGFFRRRVTEIINKDPRLEVVATADHGKDGLDKTLELKPDVITMDYEMPVMDGVTAVKNIMAQCPTPVLMFSSLTFEGARVTLDALEAGAVDFLSKQFDAIAATEAELHKTLTDRICEVAASGKKCSASAAGTALRKTSDRAETSEKEASEKNKDATPEKKASAPPRGSLRHAEIVILGTSTGGPAALQAIFKSLSSDFDKPIVIVQHMPGSFTKAFAERLNKITHMTVTEAQDGDRIEKGHVYVAPGGMQLMVDSRNNGCIHVKESSDERVTYRPSVDIALASAAKHFGKKALAVILTGMGSDGKEGAALLKGAGGTVWAQDEESCVIYGMPMAVVKAGIAENILPLDEIADQICSEAG